MKRRAFMKGLLALAAAPLFPLRAVSDEPEPEFWHSQYHEEPVEAGDGHVLVTDGKGGVRWVDPMDETFWELKNFPGSTHDDHFTEVGDIYWWDDPLILDNGQTIDWLDMSDLMDGSVILAD